MGHWLGDAYRVRVVDTGREPLFLLLPGLLGSFLFIRISARMIRRGAKWWPGNVRPGGTHIHHVVFGQVMMPAGGVGAFAVRGGGRVAYDLLAVLFGLGCGLVLDEYALVLHLEDVYWKEEGRQSVDAVILAVAVIGLLLVGQAPLGGYVGGRSYRSYPVAAVLVAFVVLCLMTGKVWTGLLGVMVPLLAVVGALRLTRPASPWARWRYAAGPRRMARAERREDGIHRRFTAAMTAAGYSVVVRRERGVGAAEWGRLAALADAWRRWRGGVEPGRVGDAGDGECVVAQCPDPRGRARAVLAFVPWGPDGLALDLVWRDRESGRAPVDFLLTEVLLRANAGTPPLDGVRRVSFNLVRRPSEPYGPRRQERYLLFERRAELPRVLAAGALAEGLRAKRRLLPPPPTPPPTPPAARPAEHGR
ncbi:phosphatidylglycerol lysyltransferase domain-containing protein [Actinacidiphila sp. ITFR-21]|uniref:phosphatidylglycerol lysyltransferase domain-containing protein n=1 Tax=Actinacidiphila sp. ITFR-21 TaxID=3075199 RepID=UPI00288BE0E8|nr:phosphatidylglycerol lysyltransferase domain-containing protein [Streptomyces sp. ITFR-21]WNI15666.1 phosphatidylglycerol lysyltransferase domain-containing protein [Streptomyces sp. ITFR-21]